MNDVAISHVTVDKLTPVIGAEIAGIDLAGRLGDRELTTIDDALMDNLVVFLRDQHLSVEQHKAFGARFGTLHAP